jgi:hypothetical protein
MNVLAPALEALKPVFVDLGRAIEVAASIFARADAVESSLHVRAPQASFANPDSRAFARSRPARGGAKFHICQRLR